MKQVLQYLVKHRVVCIYISLISGIALAFLGALLHPLGEIDATVLVMTGQLLVLVAGLFGMNIKLPYGSSNPDKFD